MKDMINMPDKDGPTGIGGWLILVAIAIVMTLTLEIFALQEILAIYQEGFYQALSDPSSDSYIPHFSTLFYLETFMGIAHVVLLVFIGYLFFRKKATFPKWYVILLVIRPVWLIVDTLAVNVVMPEIVDMLDLNAQNTQDIVRAVLPLCIWGPYMKMSVRVKNTFVN